MHAYKHTAQTTQGSRGQAYRKRIRRECIVTTSVCAPSKTLCRVLRNSRISKLSLHASNTLTPVVKHSLYGVVKIHTPTHYSQYPVKQPGKRIRKSLHHIDFTKVSFRKSSSPVNQIQTFEINKIIQQCQWRKAQLETRLAVQQPPSLLPLQRLVGGKTVKFGWKFLQPQVFHVLHLESSELT